MDNKFKSKEHFLTYYITNNNDENILYYKTNQYYYELDDSDKGLFHNLLIEYSFKTNTSIEQIFNKQLSQDEILHIVQRVNIHNLLKNNNLLDYIISLINKLNNSIELRTSLSSLLLRINPNYIINYEINEHQLIQGYHYNKPVPFWVLYTDENRLSSFLKNNEVKYLSDELITNIIEFCLCENLTNSLIIISEFFQIDLIEKNIHLYEIFNPKYDFTHIFNLFKSIIKTSKTIKESAPLKLKFIGSFINIVYDLKYIYKKDFNEDFINFPFSEAKKIEDEYDIFFCNYLFVSDHTINQLLNNNFKLNFNESKFNELSHKSQMMMIEQNHDCVFLQDKNNYYSMNENNLKKIKEILNNKLSSFKKAIQIEPSPINSNPFNHFLTPLFFIKKLNECKSILDISLLCTGKKSSYSIDLVKKLIYPHIQVNKLYMLYALNETKFNYNIINNLMNTIINDNIIIINLDDLLLIKKSFSFLNDNKLLKLFIFNGLYNHYTNHVSLDLIKQLKLIDSSGSSHLFNDVFNSKTIKKIKNNVSLHSTISKLIINKMKQKDFQLNQSNIDKLHSLNFKEFQIHVPKTNFELIHCGNDLDICVGDGYYAEDVLSKNINIIFLKQKDNIIYCINLSTNQYNIIEASSVRNKSMDIETKKELEIFIKGIIK